MTERDTQSVVYSLQQAREVLQEHAARKGRPLRAVCTTFGCQMNARDAEMLRGMLEEIGYILTDVEEEADLVLYNTCTVREHADRKIYGRLGRWQARKKEEPDCLLGICGCMPQEEGVRETIRRAYPYVNFVFGTHNLEALPELIVHALADPTGQEIAVLPDAPVRQEGLPTRLTYSYKAGVNIMYGCNNFCTYCIVPYVRGREKSRTPEEICAEIRDLLDRGVKEIMLLGQNVNSYGKTLPEGVSFAELLAQIAVMPGMKRLRFMTSHPKDLSPELIRTMAAHPNICPHLHLPLQSGSSRILERMNRHYTKEDYLQLVEALREAMPDISLTTDLIVGFPGETEEDFQETLDVVRQVRFDTAFTFLYSKRSGTPAAEMEDQIDPKTAHDRFDRLLQLVQEIGRERTARFTGTVQEVLVEGPNAQEPGYLTGRMANNTLVHFSGADAEIGDLVPVLLERCEGFYYIGKKA